MPDRKREQGPQVGPRCLPAGSVKKHRARYGVLTLEV